MAGTTTETATLTADGCEKGPQTFKMEFRGWRFPWPVIICPFNGTVIYQAGVPRTAGAYYPCYNGKCTKHWTNNNNALPIDPTKQ